MPDRPYCLTSLPLIVTHRVVMDQRATELLQAFVKQAHTTKLLPEDWQRFFDLTVHVHQHGLFVTGQQIRLHLSEQGFSADMSSRMGYLFELFGRLLTRYDQTRVE
jgi:hypothetical protein